MQELIQHVAHARGVALGPRAPGGLDMPSVHSQLASLTERVESLSAAQHTATEGSARAARDSAAALAAGDDARGTAGAAEAVAREVAGKALSYAEQQARAVMDAVRAMESRLRGDLDSVAASAKRAEGSADWYTQLGERLQIVENQMRGMRQESAETYAKIERVRSAEQTSRRGVPSADEAEGEWPAAKSTRARVERLVTQFQQSQASLERRVEALRKDHSSG